MYRFTIELAETVLAVDALFDSSQRLCRDYLTDKPADLIVSMTEDDLENERAFAENKDATGKSLEWVALYRKICTELAHRDIVLIHGSCIAVDGQAYLFCAPSGTGKSTHTRFWREYLGKRAIMINDDKPLVRIHNDSAVIYGTPWNGKHHLGTNTSAPLKAISFINRGEINSIEKTASVDAFPKFMKYVFRPEDPKAMIHVLDTVARVADLSVFWTLKCNMSQEAAIVSFKAMSDK